MLWLRRTVAPDPDRLSVSHGEGEFSVQLRRREASRRMTLRVSSATGEIVLTLPLRVRLADAKAFLESHSGWIAARIGRLPGRIPFADGTVVPLRGEPHRILHWSEVRGPARATTVEGGEPVIAVSGDPAGLAGRVRRFLAGEAQLDVTSAARRHADRLGVPIARITIRDTRSRWGSCSSTGALSFSWRLILAPPSVLDYLAAHEVAHLRELNHSHRFWKLVHDLCPATEEAERWLKRHGAGLHRYG